MRTHKVSREIKKRIKGILQEKYILMYLMYSRRVSLGNTAVQQPYYYPEIRLVFDG